MLGTVQNAAAGSDTRAAVESAIAFSWCRSLYSLSSTSNKVSRAFSSDISSRTRAARTNAATGPKNSQPSNASPRKTQMISFITPPKLTLNDIKANTQPELALSPKYKEYAWQKKLTQRFGKRTYVTI